jgi:peptidoglycan/LPS O-acetylase OafA/YrhL
MNLPQLTFTRFIAALSVVVIHFGLFTWPFSTNVLFPIFVKALCAVSYFFVLSGFILVVSAAKNNDLAKDVNTKVFWINRISRILPIYLVSITVYFLFHFNYNPDIPLKWQVMPFIRSLFLVQAWNYRSVMDVNYPAWSLSVEAFFYFIFPWLYVQLQQYSTKRLVYISTIAWLGNIYLYTLLVEENAPHNLIHYFPIFHVSTFVAGIVSGIAFVRHYSYLVEKRMVIHFFAVGATLFILLSIYKDFFFWKYYQNGLLAPWFIILIFSLAVLSGKIKSFFSSRPLIFMGDISYSLYLMQLPVMEILKKYYPGLQVSDTRHFALYLLVLIVCSAICYWLIEMPSRKLIRSFLTKAKTS